MGFTLKEIINKMKKLRQKYKQERKKEKAVLRRALILSLTK
jgi:hypothetical protein